jgi:hypothetical protein
MKKRGVQILFISALLFVGFSDPLVKVAMSFMMGVGVGLWILGREGRDQK